MKREFIDKVIKNGAVDTKKYRYVYSVSAEKAEIRRIAIDLLDTTATINGWEIVKVIDDGTNQFGICACIRSIESSRDLIEKGDVEKVFAYLSDVEAKNGPFFNKTMWEAFDIVFPGYRDGLETTETTETETTETETTETETTETTETETATGRRFYDTEHGICITDFDLLEEWKNDPCIRREYPWFDWYVAACQTYQGGTLEEIR